MITATIMGNICDEPRINNEGKENQVVSFRVASNYYAGKDREIATYVEVVLFGDRWEKRIDMIQKGMSVSISGALYNEPWESGDKKGFQLKLVPFNGQALRFHPKGDDERDGYKSSRRDSGRRDDRRDDEDRGGYSRGRDREEERPRGRGYSR